MAKAAMPGTKRPKPPILVKTWSTKPVSTGPVRPANAGLPKPTRTGSQPAVQESPDARFRQLVAQEPKVPGAYVKLIKPTPMEPLPEGFKKKLAAEIKSLSKSSPKSELLATKQRMLQLAQNFEGLKVKPSANAVVRALAETRGSNREKLLPWLKAARALEERNDVAKAGGLYTGTINNTLNALVGDVPRMLETRLAASRAPMTSAELSKLLEKPEGSVRHGLQLLHLTGTAQKLPPETKGPGGQTVRWVHRDVPAPIPKKNVGFRILQALSAGPKTAAELRQITSMGDRAVRNQIDRLEPAEIISTRRIPRPNGRINGTKPAEFSLNGKGHSIMRRQKASPTLLPDVSAILLGEKPESIPDRVDRNIQKLQRQIELAMEYERLPRNSRGIVVPGHFETFMKKHGLNKGSQNYLMLRHLPVSGATREHMETTVLPELRARSLVAADYLQQFMLRNPKRFPRSRDANRQSTRALQGKLMRRQEKAEAAILAEAPRIKKAGPGAYKNFAKRIRDSEMTHDAKLSFLTLVRDALNREYTYAQSGLGRNEHPVRPITMILQDKNGVQEMINTLEGPRIASKGRIM